MNKYLFIILLATIVVFTNCKEPEPISIWMAYLETKCADPWGTGEGNVTAEVEDAVLIYFEGLDITIHAYDSMMDADQGEDCESCDCKTGRTIRLQVDQSFQAQLEEEGFVEE